MPHAPLVSIIVPAYNYAGWLKETLQSVQRQTLSSWECIVVDDGSTDDTKGVVAAVAKGDPRIAYHYQSNRGSSSARNVGVQRSSGRYLQFLDADDLIAEEKLASQARLMETDPEIDICYCNYQAFDSETGRLLERSNERLGADPLADFLLRWERGLCIPIHAPLFRRSLWKGPLIFNERDWEKEDWLMWIDLARSGFRFSFIDQDWAFYRMHSSNRHRATGSAMAIGFAKAAAVVVETIPETYRVQFIESSFAHVRNYEDFQATIRRSTSADGGMASATDMTDAARSSSLLTNRILFELFMRLDARSRSEVGDVFTPEGEAAFLGWAVRPADQAPFLSPFLTAVYRLRADVAAAFPDLLGRDREAFLSWARTSGATEMGYETDVVCPVQPPR